MYQHDSLKNIGLESVRRVKILSVLIYFVLVCLGYFAKRFQRAGFSFKG